MSARKVDHASLFSSLAFQGQSHLSISANDVRVQKNGIEFQSAQPVTTWTEMTIELRSPDRKTVNCSGVVVACNRHQHGGYRVSMLFTHLSKHSQQILSTLVSSQLK